MKKSTIKKIEKLESLALIISNLKSIYNDSTEVQKSFIETTVGAALFYVDNSKELYSGKISSAAYEALKNKKKNISQLTKEHYMPRKQSAKEMLELNSICNKKLTHDFYTKLGVYNYVLPDENKKLIKFQKKHPSNPDAAYKEAGIELLNIPFHLLKLS